MYPNLNAELARVGITRLMLAAKLGVAPGTLSVKLNGKSDLSLAECVKIKEIVAPEKTLEYLFASNEKEVE